jgi:hypothetical protein
METGHKSDWLDYTKKIHDEKYDLLKKHYEEWAKYRTDHIRDMENIKDLDKLFTDSLNKAISLHKKQKAEWRTLCEKHYSEAKQIDKKHSQQLSNFLGEAKDKKAKAE